MKPEKLIKKQIIKEASSNPNKYFPVKALEELGLKRYKCSKCSTMFWSIKKREICGDTNCVGKYSFIEETPAKTKMEFAQTYQLFRKFLEKKGYMHVNRFPIVARWREDLDFNIASIVGFQPYVTKGIVAPPAQEIIIPQNCLRFSDIDNVGYTGRHGTNFVMIGQLAFKNPQNFEQEKYLKDLFEWFTIIMKIPEDEIQIHEDAWAGGGDCGPSMEFFSCGLELANQVYMLYDMSEAQNIKELKPLKIKVLDMGMGLERCCWFSKGSVNQYEATMPKVCKYLFKKTGLVPNLEIYKKFLPYSGNLNLDETDNIDKEWENIATKIKIPIDKLRKVIEPIAGIYSIADHCKTLLYALNDGALPSNVKGGYNLRLVLRRALDFIYKFKWDLNLYEIIKLHADEVYELYPEMKNELDGIKKIIDLEIKKYETHKLKVENKIKNLIKKKIKITNEEFIKYYISDGITPDEIQTSFKNQEIKIEIPQNFFSLVNEFFESRKLSENKIKKNKLLEFTKNLPETKMEFYKNSYKEKSTAKIIKKFEINGKKYIILDSTIFYPTMGGQLHDVGEIDGKKVIDVLKINKIILHQVE